MGAVRKSLPVFLRRTRPPRQNSCVIVPVTKPHRAKQRPDAQKRTPTTASTEPTATADNTGHKNCCLALDSVAFRHASRGPTPVKNRRTKPTGAIQRL